MRLLWNCVFRNLEIEIWRVGKLISGDLLIDSSPPRCACSFYVFSSMIGSSWEKLQAWYRGNVRNNRYSESKLTVSADVYRPGSPSYKLAVTIQYSLSVLYIIPILCLYAKPSLYTQLSKLAVNFYLSFPFSDCIINLWATRSKILLISKLFVFIISHTISCSLIDFLSNITRIEIRVQILIFYQ
jgi:hypothetical protein